MCREESLDEEMRRDSVSLLVVENRAIVILVNTMDSCSVRVRNREKRCGENTPGNTSSEGKRQTREVNGITRSFIAFNRIVVLFHESLT